MGALESGGSYLHGGGLVSPEVLAGVRAALLGGCDLCVWCRSQD